MWNVCRWARTNGYRFFPWKLRILQHCLVQSFREENKPHAKIFPNWNFHTVLMVLISKFVIFHKIFFQLHLAIESYLGVHRKVFFHHFKDETGAASGCSSAVGWCPSLCCLCALPWLLGMAGAIILSFRAVVHAASLVISVTSFGRYIWELRNFLIKKMHVS